ncbi:MAG: hypothetical protein WC852_01670 [Candidatus Nanoarchaeia archaeon]|jgi:hypothetical protein
MDFLFLLPVAVFAGFPLGILLAWIAKEELSLGTKYIGYFRQILIFAIAVMSLVLLFTHAVPWVGLLSIASGIILAVVLNIAHAKLERKKYNFFMDYFFLGLCLVSAIAVLDKDMLLIFSSLVFIYGLPYSSIFYSKLRNSTALISFNLFLFFAPFPFLLLGDVAVVGFGVSAFYLLLRAR